jgi:hypothetical protein
MKSAIWTWSPLIAAGAIVVRKIFAVLRSTRSDDVACCFMVRPAPLSFLIR